MPLLRHQRQRFPTGCGPACIAMIARTTQLQACKVIFGETRRRSYFTDWADVKRALKLLRVQTGPRAYKVTDWDSIQSLSLVGCSRLADGTWHLVVCSPKERLIYDPWRPRPVPLARMRRKPFSYLSVRP